MKWREKLTIIKLPTLKTLGIITGIMCFIYVVGRHISSIEIGLRILWMVSAILFLIKSW